MPTLALALTALAVGPPDALAQESPEELRARLDSLRPLLIEARAEHEAHAAERTERERLAAARAARIDTFHVGGATVLTPLDESPRTRELFADIWSEHFAGLGESPSLARSVITFQWRDEPVPIHVEGDHHRVAPGAWTRRSDVAEAVRGTLAAVIHHDISGSRSTEVGDWAGGNPLLPAATEEVYRRVALTRSKATRDCLSGDLDACRSAMGLDAWEAESEITAMTEAARLRERQARFRESIAEWYAPEERRALIESRVRIHARAPAEARDDCVLEGHIEACDELLAQVGRDWTPFGPETRTSLVAFALRVGGDGAWSRLMQDPEMTPVEAMEHASGAGIDELLAGWHAALLAARPDAFEDLAPRSGLTLLWTLFFAALALRSTRWRLG